MSTTPADTARHVRARLRAEQARADAHAARALGLARDLAARLRAERGVDRVWLTGSLARGTAHERSDVDLVLDVDPTRASDLRDWIAGLELPVDVDVLVLAALPATWRARVEREGIPL